MPATVALRRKCQFADLPRSCRASPQCGLTTGSAAGPPLASTSAFSWSLNAMGHRHGNHSQRHSSRAMEHEQDRRPESSVRGQGHLGALSSSSMESAVRELALFNLGMDSKLRGCDIVALRTRDIWHGDQVASRAVVMQRKASRPVQFEITAAARDAVQKWIKTAGLKSDDFLFPSRIHAHPLWVRANTPGSSKAGSRSLALTQPSAARTRCGEPKRR
jgi:hypothetical protein